MTKPGKFGMGNCCRKRAMKDRNIVLLLIGLDNAGKTVTVRELAREPVDESPVPTNGFSVVDLKYLDFDIKIYDVGGSSGIRGIWPRYFIDAHGIIFVVDSSDHNRLQEVKQQLIGVLSHEKVQGKPILLLANKQDNPNALDEADIIEELDLERLVNDYKCPTLIELCSAKQPSMNNSIRMGYQWLLNYIRRNYDTLNERVTTDIIEERQEQQRLRAEKLERMKQSNQLVVDPTTTIIATTNGTNNSNHDHQTIRLNSAPARPHSATAAAVRKQLERSPARSFWAKHLQGGKTAPAPNVFYANGTTQQSASSSGERERRRMATKSAGDTTHRVLVLTGLPNAVPDGVHTITLENVSRSARTVRDTT